MANGNVSYPTIAGIGPAVPSFAGGPVIPANVVSARVVSEDTLIPGAIRLDPASAAAFFTTGHHGVNHMAPGPQEPLETKSKLVSQTLATGNSPNFRKLPLQQQMSDATLFGRAKPQAPFVYPWNKKFIPPLSLFNDASQWVNRLMFNPPGTWWGAQGIGLRPPRKSTWLSSPPINTNNLGAGNLNLQLQLGQLMIQQQQLTLTASNYFGA